jgi:hypothetical protein
MTTDTIPGPFRTVDLGGADIDVTNPVMVRALMDAQGFDTEFTFGIDPVRDVARKAYDGIVALAAYYEHLELNPEHEEPCAQILADLLADLRHTADALGLNFDTAVEDSYTNYRAERGA